MTEKQALLLRFLADFQAKRGFTASFTDMMVAMGTKSRGCMHAMILRMVDEGLVFKRSNVARSVELTEKGLALIGRAGPAPKIDLKSLSDAELTVLLMEAKIEFGLRVDVMLAEKAA